MNRGHSAGSAGSTEDRYEHRIGLQQPLTTSEAAASNPIGVGSIPSSRQRCAISASPSASTSHPFRRRACAAKVVGRERHSPPSNTWRARPSSRTAGRFAGPGLPSAASWSTASSGCAAVTAVTTSWSPSVASFGPLSKMKHAGRLLARSARLAQRLVCRLGQGSLARYRLAWQERPSGAVARHQAASSEQRNASDRERVAIDPRGSDPKSAGGDRCTPLAEPRQEFFEPD